MVKRCCNALDDEEGLVGDDIYDNLHIHEPNSRNRFELIMLEFVEGMQQELSNNGLLVTVLSAGYGNISIAKNSVKISHTPSSI